jgi:hypothetical protein
MTCPAQYAAKYIHKTVVFQDTEATIWGTRVHTCAENILKGMDPNDADVVPLVEPYCKALVKAGGVLSVEKELAFTDSWAPVGWWDKKAWIRGKLDVEIDQGEIVKIYDWKTGKQKTDDFQLKMFCTFSAIERGLAQNTYEARYIWLKDKKVSDPLVMTRNDVSYFALELGEMIHRIRMAEQEDNFVPRPNGLCKAWCDVVNCKHNGRGR